MRRFIVAANWKMHFVLEEALNVARDMAKDIKASVEVIVFPPAVFIHPVFEIFKQTHLKLGAQNIYFEQKGAFTGEISAAMVKSLGCEYVIVGHSERRHIFSESDIEVHKKVKAAIENDLKVVVCVGETLKEREQNKAFDVVERQIVSALDGIDLEKVVVAYEPVWAIGTGVAADVKTITQMHNFIRELVENVPILYGGSVKDSNAFELGNIDNVDGFLVGSASLKSDSFSNIIAAFEKAKGVGSA
ncbi:triose-phosphate isomerase [Hippea jasoniae]|uniref:triose-phosphate isomerase n=1 Tax=Hippea jasoniae TaxID=944479 RepID=UPI00055827BC|nr:triose-phosphate isomerase [Hippea jasoniae]